MSRTEFHRLYEQGPEEFRAELIGGIVHVPSPLRRAHGSCHAAASSVLVAYEGRTPGVEVGDNATILLGADSEPQPDLYLRILPECGGRTRTTEDDYIEGPPELILEISSSGRSIDLHAKRDDYARHGVSEYGVWIVGAGLRWYDLKAGREVPPDGDTIHRSRVFPGLWVHGGALLARDHLRAREALEKGLASPEHAAFVRRLAEARGGRPASGST